MNKNYIFATIIILFLLLSINNVVANDLNESDINQINIQEIDYKGLNDNPSKAEVILNPYNLTKHYGNPSQFTISLKDSENISLKNQTIKININNMNYTRNTDDLGIARMNINLESGIYTAFVSYSGNGNYSSANANSTITILSTVEGKNIIKMYKNDTQYIASFLDSNGNPLSEGTIINFNINGVFYERKIYGNQGLAKLNINLDPGNYIITATNTLTNQKSSNNITVLPTIVENKNLIKYYRNASRYEVKLLDFQGKNVGAGQTAKFNINGVFYERITNNDGIVGLNINLNPGDYIITAEYNGCEVSNNIRILPILIANDLTKEFGVKKAFEVLVLDDIGNPYPNQVVQFNINGVFYNRTSDSTGYSKLNINLNVGEYIITSMFNMLSISNKVIVTPAQEHEDDTLQKLIDKSKDTLDLNKDYGYEGTITINKNITINANGHTIDAEGNGPVFNITPNTKVTFKNMNLVNANVHDEIHGGAIQFYGDTLECINCNFRNNTIYTIKVHQYTGGGVIFSTGNVKIMNSTFLNNYANTSDGNYIYVKGGAILTLGNIDISDSIFIDNFAKAWGGCVYAYGNVNVTNSVFDRNRVNGGGGAAIYSEENDMSISNCRFTNHVGGKSGPGATIFTRKNVECIDSEFINNTALAHNAADICAWGNLKIENSTFINSTRGSVSGEEVWIRYSIFENITLSEAVSATNATIENTKFFNNHNNTEYIINLNGGLTNGRISHITDCIFLNNTAITSIIRDNHLIVKNSQFMKNHVTPRNLGDGDIIFAHDTLEVYDSIFSDNNNVNSVLKCWGNMTARNLTFTNNSNVSIQCHNLTMNDSYFENNIGRLISSDKTRINDCEFINNVNYYEDSRDIIDIYGDLIAKNSKFINNSVNNGKTISAQDNVTVLNCSFINNTGSAISSFGNVIAIDSLFLNNSGSECGAIQSYRNVNVTNCQFISNTALEGNYGAILIGYENLVEKPGILTNINSTFINNYPKDTN